MLPRFLVILLMLCAPVTAQAKPVASTSDIEAALTIIRSAALESKGENAAAVMASDLVLVSQSGKVYGKDAAIVDLRNGFISWDNSEVVIQTTGKTAIVTLLNERTREGMEAAKFRVLQVWRKTGRNWLLAAQSSSAVKK